MYPEIPGQQNSASLPSSFSGTPIQKNHDVVLRNGKTIREYWLNIFIGLVAVLLLVSAAGANSYEGGIPLTTEKKGVVSGGIWFDAYPGFATTGQKSFSLPKYTSIDWARVYVGVYCGHKQNNYNGIAHVNFDSDGDGVFETLLGDEQLNVAYSYPGEGGTGPVWLNGHLNRVTSDYLMWYDIRDRISTDRVGVKVTTEKVNPSFDGRIKFIALVIAYNDDDGDKVYYWINQGHDPMYTEDDFGYVGETSFGTSEITEYDEDSEQEPEAKLSSLYMASNDGSYTFNSEELDSGIPQGSYFGYETWDVTDSIIPGEDSTLSYKEGAGASSEYSSGAYFKIPLALLSYRLPERPVGMLEVTSNPLGADITIDDEETGMRTNTTINGLSVGEHTVMVSLANNQSFREPDERQVVIHKNEGANLHFDFEQINGSIDISSEPGGAWVYLDGINQSVQTDILLEDIMIGDHTVSLKKTGYETWEDTITVSEDQTETITEALIEGGGNQTAGKTGESEQYGYGGRSLSLYRHGTVNGGLVIADSSDYSGLLEKGMSKAYPVAVNLSGYVTVTDGRLYVYSTWSYNTGNLKGKPASVSVDSEEGALTFDRSYLDRKGDGIYDYPAETHSFLLDENSIRSGTMTFTVTNKGDNKDVFAVYGVLLVLTYEDPNADPVEFWIGEGSDIIYANPDFQVDTLNATTRMSFPGKISSPDTVSGTLYAVSTASTGSSENDNRITFNGKSWTNRLTGGSSSISVVNLSVTGSLMPTANNATIGSIVTGSKGDYMENRNIILVLSKTGDESASLLPDDPASDDTGGVVPDVSSTNESADIIPASGPVEEIIDPSRQLYEIRVISNPPGALISVDYQYSGKTTPATIVPLPGGNHTFLLEREGFEPMEERYFITNNETLKFDLPLQGISSGSMEKISSDNEALLDQELFGGVYVTSSPDGATIYIDGKKTSLVTPGVVYGLADGKHTVKVMKGKQKDKVSFPVESKEVWVDEGVVTPVAFSVAENPVLLNPVINSTGYYDSEFTFNGQTTIKRIPAEINLQSSSPSDNFIVVRIGDAYLSNNLVLSYDVDEIEIEPRYYSLQNLWVESDPAGADIYLDGFPTGYSTPYLIRNVSDGHHIVSLSKPGYLPVESTLWMSDKDQVRRFIMESYLHGSLEVTSEPSGGKIYINNKNTGQKTPFTFQYLQAGTYTVKVVQNKTQDTTPDVIVEPFASNTVNLVLAKK